MYDMDNKQTSSHIFEVDQCLFSTRENNEAKTTAVFFHDRSIDFRRLRRSRSHTITVSNKSDTLTASKQAIQVIQPPSDRIE